jgi:hypothetical protein
MNRVVTQIAAATRAGGRVVAAAVGVQALPRHRECADARVQYEYDLAMYTHFVGLGTVDDAQNLTATMLP